MSDLRFALRERDEVAMFDHEPKDALLGHGGRCYRGCKPLDRIVHDRWYEGGVEVTDPDRIKVLDAKAREQEQR